MTDLQAHAAQVRVKRDELRAQFPSGDCWLTATGALNTTAGAIVQVPVDLAAERIVSGSHRLSERAEIQRCEQEQAEQARAIRAAAPPKGTLYFKDGRFQV